MLGIAGIAASKLNEDRLKASLDFYGDLWSVSLFHLFHTKKWFENCAKYLTDEIKDFILANINTASSCCVKGKCQSVENATILGKSFNGRVCGCSPFTIDNPDGKTLLYAKELTTICMNIFAEWLENGIV